MATPEIPQVELAHFKTLPAGGAPPVEFDVHFNPASLQYTVSNTLKEEGSGSSKKQYVDKTTAKLTMQLVFDTTDTGEDVRAHSDKMAKLLKPVPEGQKQVPPNVEFGWGLYRFTGMVEQYKETIDFFSADGVPLRSTVDITLASQDVQFDSAKNPPASVDRAGELEPAVVPGGGGPSGVANALGDPRAARAIASANGSMSLRFGVEGGLAVGAGVELKAEAGFSAGASAGVGIGGGAGIGIGGGAGIGVGVGAGGGIGGGASVGVSGGIGGGVGVSGGIGVSGGAGVSGGIGAAGAPFAELRTGVKTSTSMPSARAMLAPPKKAGAVSGNGQFAIGGQAQAEAGASLSADVGANAGSGALIRFD